MPVFIKEPSTIAPYTFDFTGMLALAETIASYTVDVGGLIDNGASLDVTQKIVTVQIGGGVLNTQYTVTVTITSNLGLVTNLQIVISCGPTHYPALTLSDYNQPTLPIEEWRSFMSWNPYHFWGLSNTSTLAISSCDDVVREYSWQAREAAGRSEIRDAIVEAEKQLKQFLQFAVSPHYVIDTLQYPRFFDRKFDKRGYVGSDGRWETLQLSEGKVIDFGVETLTLLGPSAVTYADNDGDGLKETFTISIATTITDPEEIACYFMAADRMDSEPASEKYRIAPVRVSISGGTVTITGRSWLCVKPIKYQGVADPTIDPDVSTNFAVNLEIYHRYTSAGTTFDTAQAVLIWETRPYPAWAYTWDVKTAGHTDPAGESYALARVAMRDNENGICGIGEAVLDNTSGEWKAPDWFTWTRPPDRVIVRYKAGVPTEQGRVAAEYRPILSKLAAAILARPICACETANRELYRWQFDLSRSKGVNDEQYMTTEAILQCPFGQRRGQWEAWKFIETRMKFRGGAYG